MAIKETIFFTVLVITLILISGCSSPGQPPVTPVTTPVPPPTTQVTPVQTTLSSTTLVTTTPGSSFTKEQVDQLFIDIAFGCDNTRITKPDLTPENHLFYSLEGQVTNDDLAFVKGFTKNYDLLTSVGAFSDDPLSTRGNPIIFYPSNSLDSLEKNFIACQELDPATGEPLYIIYKSVLENPNGQTSVTTKIYLNSDLTGASRNHDLEKAMLSYLGFPGQTYTYPDSVFYYNAQSNVNFTPIDIEAMKTMYNPGIYSGMTIQEVRRLLLNTN